jgi:hypothetical protein
MDLSASADVELTLKPSANARLAVEAGGNTFQYDASAQMLTTGSIRAPLALAGGVLSLRILLDRGSVELFAGDGAVAISLPADRSSRGGTLKVASEQGDVEIVSGTAHDMGSIWPAAK